MPIFFCRSLKFAQLGSLWMWWRGWENCPQLTWCSFPHHYLLYISSSKQPLLWMENLIGRFWVEGSVNLCKLAKVFQLLISVKVTLQILLKKKKSDSKNHNEMNLYLFPSNSCNLIMVSSSSLLKLPRLISGRK